MVQADLGKSTVTDATSHEPGEQVARPAPVPERRLGRTLDLAGRGSLTCLDRLPEIVADDPQLGHLDHHPLPGIVEPRHSLAGRRVLDVAQPVPDQPAEVKFVVQDAGAAGDIAGDRARAPGAAVRACHAFPVQRLGNRLGRLARSILLEDPPRDRGLSRLNAAQAPFRHSVPIRRAGTTA